MKKQGWRVAAALLVLLLAPVAVLADGVFIPEVARKLPRIPLQRAILAHRDGKETLVVESSLEGGRGAYGWIIPVPATPTRLEKVSPGLLRTIALQTEPQIRNAKFPGELVIVFAFLALFTPFALFMRRPLWLLVFLGLTGFIVLPNFLQFRMGASGDAPTPRIEEISRRQIGSYETAVLGAASAADLNAWLRENGFAQIPAAGAPAVEEYVAKKWRFVAAKLTLGEDGLAAPHPLLIEFPAPSPVYPMKLTALAETKLRLELFVVARERATPGGYRLRTEFCDTLSQAENESGERLRSQTFGRTVAQADLGRILWDGCVLTRLAGEVAPEAMREDLLPGFTAVKPELLTLFSRDAAKKEAAEWAALVYGLGILVVSCLPAAWRLRAFIALAVVTPAVSLASYIAAGEKVDVVVIGRSRSNLEGLRSSLVAYIAEYEGTPEADALASGGPDGPPRTAREQLLKQIWVESGNPYTGEPLRVEDSPGNFTVEVRQGRFAGFLLHQRDGKARLVPAFGYLEKITLPEVIAELSNPHQEVRARVALELGKRRERSALVALQSLATSGEKTDKAAATVALADITRDPAYGDRLVGILLRPPEHLRGDEAERVLKSLEGFPLLPALIRRLKDQDEAMRTAAVWRLSQKPHDPRAVAPLVEAFKDPSSNVRASAANALRDFPAALAGETLIASLRDADPLVRQGAAKALGGVRDPRASGPLAAAASQPDETLRANALRALGEIGGPEVVAPLVAALKDPVVTVRAVAAEALGKTRDPRAIAPLVSCYEERKMQGEVITALARIGTRGAVEVLLNLPTEKWSQYAIDHALREVTGQKDLKGRDWKRWWEQNGRTAPLRPYP